VPPPVRCLALALDPSWRASSPSRPSPSGLCGHGHVQLGDLARGEGHVGRAGVLDHRRHHRRPWDGHDPRLLSQEPRQGDLRRRRAFPLGSRAASHGQALGPYLLLRPRRLFKFQLPGVPTVANTTCPSRNASSRRFTAGESRRRSSTASRAYTDCGRDALEAPPACPDEPQFDTQNLGQYDPRSVMHYFCGGVGSPALAITDIDKVSSQKVYGPSLSTFTLEG